MPVWLAPFVEKIITGLCVWLEKWRSLSDLVDSVFSLVARTSGLLDSVVGQDELSARSRDSVCFNGMLSVVMFVSRVVFVESTGVVMCDHLTSDD